MVAAAVGEGAGLPAPPPGLRLQVHVVDGGGVVLVLVRHHCAALGVALLDSLLDALTDTLLVVVVKYFYATIQIFSGPGHGMVAGSVCGQAGD